MFEFKLIVSLCLLQARIVALNAHYFLKNGGHFVISIKVNFSFSQNFNFHTIVLYKELLYFFIFLPLLYIDFETESPTNLFLIYHINAG